MVESRLQLEFACRLARLRHDSGQHRVHEHPENAISIAEPCVTKLQHDTQARKLFGGPMRVRAHPTRYRWSGETKSNCDHRFKHFACKVCCSKNVVARTHICKLVGFRVRMLMCIRRVWQRALVNGIQLQKKWGEQGRVSLGIIDNVDEAKKLML